MRAGSLRHRIRIQRRSTGQDATGDPVGTWRDFAVCRASIEPKTGHETPTGYAKVMTGFRVRYVAGVDPSMRIVWTDPAENKSHVYDIKSVIDTKAKHAELQIQAEELVGATP